jgi:hypothetical protein
LPSKQGCLYFSLLIFKFLSEKGTPQYKWCFKRIF